MKKETKKKILATGVSLAMVVSLLSNNGFNREVKGDTTNNNFARALQESLYFFDANMCGGNVKNESAFSWRDNCHTGDELVKFNGKTVDVSGGYHDAGDHVKFGLPQAYSATMLGLSYYEYGDAYKEYGLTKHYKNIMKHFVDYFEKCTVLDGNGNVEAFCYQVGDGNRDHSYWGKPEEQDSKQGNRVNQAYFSSSDNPATDIVSETAAALAIYYLNFKDEKALNYSRKLFAYAQKNNKKAATNGPDEFYKSQRIEDDYCMAAIMLYKATKNSTYSNEFKNYSGKCNEWAWLSWDDVSGLALNYGSKEGLYSNPNGNPLGNCFNNMKNGSKVTNGYYCLNNWGSTRYNCNMDAMAFMLGGDSNINWALGQLDYILGNDNRSYVVGHTKFELYPHYRASSGYNDVNANGKTKHKHVLVGALVGGPDQDGNFVNDASKYQYTEVALDYNAGFVFACAGAACRMISIGDKNQKTVDDSTLSNEFRSSVMNAYRTEAASARSGNVEESSSEETTKETEKETESEKETVKETESSVNNETQKPSEESNYIEEPSGNEESSNVEESSHNTETSKNDEVTDSKGSSSDSNVVSKSNTGKTVNKKVTTKKTVKKEIVKAKKRSGKIKINLKNKKKYKKSKKIKIKSRFIIKSIRLNSKNIKFKKNKKKVKFKLKKYKKFLKKRKYNILIIKDIYGNKKIIKFKVK